MSNLKFVAALLCGCCLAAFLVPSLALAQSGNIDQMAERLIGLRAEVEELQSELDIQREEHKGRMAYLAAQRTELDANREREELRIQQLQQQLQKMQEQTQNAGADADSLQPIVFDVLQQLRVAVQQTLPFKRGERLAELDEIQQQLEAGTANPQRSLNRLWAFIEDELRISRENAIYSQTIDLKGQSILADVAKLGSVAMYFKTRDDRYGMATPSGENWNWVIVEDSSGREQIEKLFDSLRKQIRQGYFELPNAFPKFQAGSTAEAQS